MVLVRNFFLFHVLLVFFVYVSALFEHLHITDVFDYEDDLFFEIVHPNELSFSYRIRPSSNFGKPFNSTIQTFSSKLVPTIPPHCCTAPGNVFNVAGNIALVERGGCTFKMKAVRAEEVGAIGVIIADYDYSSDVFIDMLDDKSAADPQIYVAFLIGKNGYVIKNTLKKLELDYADINIPLNFTRIGPIGPHAKRQPPWLLW